MRIRGMTIGLLTLSGFGSRDLYHASSLGKPARCQYGVPGGYSGFFTGGGNFGLTGRSSQYSGTGFGSGFLVVGFGFLIWIGSNGLTACAPVAGHRLPAAFS